METRVNIPSPASPVPLFNLMHMGIIKATVEEQGKGQFNGGEIEENKPIGFPQDGGKMRPYSNLVYWAHAWTDMGSTIGEHPHQGFEIMSFVLKGDLEHYDSKQDSWSPLNTGDAQIIRAGNGISHSEKMNKGAHMFQIWLDPDLTNSMYEAASYDDYPSADIAVSEEEGYKVKIYAGDGGAMRLETEGVSIKEYSFEAGTHKLDTTPANVYSVFQLEGSSTIGTAGDSEVLETGDFAKVDQAEVLTIECDAPGKYFIIESPLRPSYRTYSEMQT